MRKHTQYFPLIATTNQMNLHMIIGKNPYAMWPRAINKYSTASTTLDNWDDPTIHYAHLPLPAGVIGVSADIDGLRITTTAGYVIRINANGSYEVTAPEKLTVEDFVKAHPTGKLLDPQGRILEFRDDGSIRLESLVGASEHVIDVKNSNTRIRESLMASSFDRIVIPDTGCHLILPDGVELVVDRDGGYQIDERNKTFTYRAAPRDFNRFLNTSDVIEDFIRYLGSLQVRQRHVMDMPLGLLIKWIIIEAAKADGEPYDDIVPPLIEGVSAVKAQPRCKFCKRFIRQTHFDLGVNFCSPQHMQRFLIKAATEIKPRKLDQIAIPPSATYFGPPPARDPKPDAWLPLSIRRAG